MTKSLSKLSAAGGLLLTMTVLSPATALAQGDSTPAVVVTSNRGGAGLGVGASAFLGGLVGPSVVYDMPRFHIEGVVGFSRTDNPGPGDDSTTQFQFGARGWYHLHQGVNSDFSIGGGFGVRTVNDGNGGSANATLIEPSAQARVFLTPNFTFNGTLGFSFVLGDSLDNDSRTGFRLGAQLLGGVGFTYFFR
ncbi:MAG: hypothetical protein ABJA82_04395 [Myxococcales bacterium]